MCLSLALRMAAWMIVQPAVEAETVDVAGGGAVVAQQFAHARVDVGIICHNRAAVAESAEVLLDDEAGGGGVAQFADLEAVAGARRCPGRCPR